VLRLPLLGFSALLALAVAGAVARWRSREVRLLAAFAGVYLGTILLFWVFGRFRVYVLPALAILAACGIAEVVAALLDGNPRRVWRALAAGAAAAAISASAPAWADMSRADHGQNYANLAGLYFERADTASALAVLARGAEEHPGSAAIPCKIGELKIRSSDPSGAIPYLGRCIALRENFPDAWYWLGVAYEQAGDPASAAPAFRRQLAIVPGHEFAARELARLGSR
jgi:tetratricopeptide (TPR) repeat protein